SRRGGRSMRRKRLWLGLAAALALAWTAACAQAAPAAAPKPGAAPAAGQPAAGAAGPSTIEQLATYDGPDRQQILEEGARKEGKLTWYTSSIRETIGQPMMAAFTKKYPFLQVD